MSGAAPGCVTLVEVTTLSVAALRHPIVGRNLGGPTFGEELGDDPTLVVLLRHPG